MGKVLIVGIFIVALVLVGVLTMISDRSEEMPQLVNRNLNEISARSLANYGVTYGIRQLMNGNVTFIDSVSGYVKDFEPIVLADGSVDSIKYVNDPTKNTIGVQSYVTVTNTPALIQYQSSADVAIFLGEDIEHNITAAIVSGGSITLKAQSFINGDVYEDTDVDFEETFGISEEDLKADAQNSGTYLDNPEIPYHTDLHNELTWVEGDLKVVQHWSGSGFLVVNGDCEINAHSDFDGILVIFGTLTMNAQSAVTGAVYVISDEESSLGAHSNITFSEASVEVALQNLPSNARFEIVSWDEM